MDFPITLCLIWQVKCMTHSKHKLHNIIILIIIDYSD